MPSELKFDETTARALLTTAPKMKPIGVSRAYRVDQPFRVGDGPEMEAGDYIVLAPNTSVAVFEAEFIKLNFEPVKKRTKRGEKP